ncbi:MAG: cell division protein FtsZ [Candidatus Accumulibacter sp.]|jgi:FtsZ-interacting cell division protein ZipA|nr:cell division protein FtsZ [Accumulibacter sp.]
MTELQMGLLGLGIVAVAGVLAYNKWQEVRHRRQMEGVLKTDHPDVLLGDETSRSADFMNEPVSSSAFDAISGADEPIVEGDDNAHPEPMTRFTPKPDAPTAPEPLAPDEPVGIPEPPAPEPPEPSVLPEPPGVRVSESVAKKVAEDTGFLSSRLDFIVAIDTVEPVSAQTIVESSKEPLARLKKPVRWIGYDEEFGEWRPISPQQGSEFRHVRAGLQLVDRQGAVSEDELAVFAAAMQELADQLTGVADIPPRQPAFEAAVALDRFCASVDIQIGINVVSQGQAFAGTQLRALAEAAGMAIDESGRFVRRDDDGNVLYVLLNQDAAGFSAGTIRTLSTHGLTFLFDVPCVVNGERVFNQMVDLAQRFADVLHGCLVDDNRRPLSAAALEPIGRQIGQCQAMLSARQLPAGSPLTRRLFS